MGSVHLVMISAFGCFESKDIKINWQAVTTWKVLDIWLSDNMTTMTAIVRLYKFILFGPLDYGDNCLTYNEKEKLIFSLHHHWQLVGRNSEEGKKQIKFQRIILSTTYTIGEAIDEL